MMKNKQKSEPMRKIERNIKIVGVFTVLAMIAEGFITNKIVNNFVYYSVILGGVFICIMCLLINDLKATETLNDWLENEEIKKLLQESEFNDFFMMNKFKRLIPNWHTGTFDALVQCLKNNNKRLRNEQLCISVLKKYYGKK